MLFPNTTGMLSRKTGKDIYSKIAYATPVSVECAIVHLNRKVQKTPVRADSSASRGAAKEEISISKILFPATVTIGKGDKFVISGLSLLVDGVEERRDVLGNIDHYEVDFGMWQ